MIDWTKSMTQTFEYYIVDPLTWADDKPIRSVKTCQISRDESAETLGSASITITDQVGEAYIRVYLIAIQNGVRYKIALGTFLIQTPSSKFDGKSRDITVDAYTPLLELKESPPPIGYSVFKEANILDTAYELCSEQVRAPVSKTTCETNLQTDFVANVNDTWLTFLTDLIANARYKFDLDEMGRVLFAPKQDSASLQPVWTYDDDNSSILYPEVTLEHDLYGIPNVVEVIYSTGVKSYTAVVVNDDPNSPISTVNRGREIKRRFTDPEIAGNPTQDQVTEYATQLLRDLSTLEYTISYTHGYCPVRVGDCVRFNYSRAGMNNIKGRVISQTIECKPGCKVTEKAVFTNNLWR